VQEYFTELMRSNELAEVSIFYYHLTSLGVDFCQVCSRQRMKELEEKDVTSRESQAPDNRRDLV